MRQLLVVSVLVLAVVGMSFAGSIYTPVAHWAFDETSGTTAYDTADGHNGTVTGATWTTAGKIGGALNFNATGNRVQISDEAVLDPTNAFTVSAWINASQFFGNGDNNGNPIIVKWGNEAIGQYHLTAYTGGSIKLRVANGINSDMLTVANVLPLNDWTHIAAQWDGSYLKVYINGILKGSKSTNITALYNKDYSEDYITIGYDSLGSSPGWNFKGLIDDVRYYDYALSASEVYQLYTIPEPMTIALLGIGALLGSKRK